jgi:transcription termination factor NusB
MTLKSTRFNLSQLLFSYVFRTENDLDNDPEIILLTAESDESKILFYEALQNFEFFKTQIASCLSEHKWTTTPYLSRAILICFALEISQGSELETSKLISQYLQLAQELMGPDNVPLIHAVMGKLIDNLNRQPKTKKPLV